MKGTSRQPSLVRSVLFEMALEQKAQGRRIAELREKKRWTQPVAADKAGVALRTYQDWESGASRPRWANLERLADAFGVSVESLIGNEPLGAQDGATPDLIGQWDGEMPGWARRLENKVDALLTAMEITLADEDRDEAAPAAPASARGRGRRRRAA